MKITILCSNALHPVNVYLQSWIVTHKSQHEIDLIRSKDELTYGSILFLISCSEIVAEADWKSYEKALVIHASDLPRGRGWSPHIWQIIDGATTLTVTLLEAATKVDSGDIWKKIEINVNRDALWDEINHLVFDAELELMGFAVENFDTIEPQPQSNTIEPTYLPKRNPIDSRIDPQKSIQDQFDLIRVCDPDRFPAYFELHGCKYTLRLEKSNA